MRNIRGNSGSATVLMMLIASVMITIGLGFNWLVREHIRASEGLKNKAEAILKARSAYDTLIYLLLNGLVSPKEIIIVGGDGITELKTLPLNGQPIPLAEDLQVRIQDSKGMLSLASLRPPVLERMIRNTAISDDAAIAASSLLDWIDADDLSRLNGAEAAYYRGQGLPYVPRNFALQYKDELGFIRGFDKGVYEIIRPYLTMLPATGFNPNTASDAVLKAYLDIDEEPLKTLKEYMSQKAVASAPELFALTGRRIPGTGEDDFYPSNFLEITVQAGAPQTIYRINAGLNLVQNRYSPYSVVSWSED
jgi:general secretion pathway protein K